MKRLIPQDNVLALVHSDEYANWVFDPSHPTQGRRFTNAANRLRTLAPELGVDLVEIEADYFPTFDQLQRAHTLEHIERTLLDGQSGEWEGTRRDLGKTALRMAGGTILAAEALLQGRAHTAVNFAGAKHHAMREHSSGFCVFNDFAIAAHYVLGSKREIYRPISKKMGKVRRIAIFDMDAHHGDGTEKLLQDSFRIFTMSVHDSSIFPGTGKYDEPDFHCFNRPLKPGSGDQALDSAASDFVLFAERFMPDMIFIAMGADGHESDPMSTLNYTTEGMVQAVRDVRRGFPEVPMLLGGAGGYQPDDITPEVWARMAIAAATPVPEDDPYCVIALTDIGYLDDPDEWGMEPVDEYSDHRFHDHFDQHAHLFAPDENDELEANTSQVQSPPETWIAPADPENEHRWRPAQPGQLKPGQRVRVRRDAFTETLGPRHNGRICEVIRINYGDVICRSIDDREPVLDGTHYSPHDLETWSEEDE